MTISLIKTIGGNNGSPGMCEKCGENHFIKSGIAWHCAGCGHYVPAKLEKRKTGFEGIKQDLEHLKGLHTKVKEMLKELEDSTEK